MFAKTTRNIEWHADPISQFDAVDCRADLDDRSKILMPEDSTGLHTSTAFIHMQIRAANVRGRNFHKHIGCFFNLGIRDFFDDYVARTFINDCFHEDSSFFEDMFRWRPYLLIPIYHSTAHHLSSKMPKNRVKFSGQCWIFTRSLRDFGPMPPLSYPTTSVGDELPESDMADGVSCSGRLGSPAYGTTEGTQPARSCGDQHGAQSTLYSVVLPSKCSLSASASARVWWTTPSR